jgi:hypothetical protein
MISRSRPTCSFLTGEKPQLLAGGPGLTIDRNGSASDRLLADLRSDEGMEWVPGQMWLTYLKVEAEASQLDYDLAIGPTRDSLPSLTDAGIEAPEARVVVEDNGRTVWPVALGAAAGIATLLALGRSSKRRRDEHGVVPRGGA